MNPVCPLFIFKAATTAIICTLVAACQILGPEDTGEVEIIEIHLQGHFDQTPVRVLFDSRVVFDSLATTDERVGLAHRIPVSAGIGGHLLQVHVNERDRLNQFIVVRGKLYIGVVYDRDQQGEVALRLSEKPFGYF